MTKDPALRQALAIVLGSMALGAAWNAAYARLPWIRPEAAASSDPRFIGAKEAREAWRQGAVFLDARPRPSYLEGHIPGARSCPIEDFDQRYAAIRAFLPADGPIVTYCSGSSCASSKRLADHLEEQGHRNVRVFDGGWPEWTGAGWPVGKGDDVGE